MNWAPTTLNSVVWITKLSKENLSKQFWQQKVNELDRKKLWEKAASKDLSFHDFMLKKYISKVIICYIIGCYATENRISTRI